VLFPTTVDDRLNLSFVYRESSFTQPEALKLIELFVKKLELFASSGRAGFPRPRLSCMLQLTASLRLRKTPCL